MTYTALEIAKYIVSYCFRKNKPVSNLKLQKMLYYAWIDFYKATRNELFLDDICAWQLGTVVPDAYYEFCSYAGRPITKTYDIHLNIEDEQLLDGIIDNYISIAVSTLVDKTHQKGMPWDLTYIGGIGIRDVIPFSLIKRLECS